MLTKGQVLLTLGAMEACDEGIARVAKVQRGRGSFVSKVWRGTSDYSDVDWLLYVLRISAGGCLCELCWTGDGISSLKKEFPAELIEALLTEKAIEFGFITSV